MLPVLHLHLIKTLKNKKKKQRLILIQMYANIYGTAGVKKAIDIMKHEISIDAGNMGVADLKKIDTSFVSPFRTPLQSDVY